MHRKSHAIGPPITRVVTGGFDFSERIQPPDWTLLNHTHDSPSIGIVLEGGCTEIVGKRFHDCVARTLQIMPAGESHTLKFGSARVRCLVVEVEAQRYQNIRRFSNILDSPLHLVDGRLAPLILKLYREFRTGADTAALTLEGLLLEILGDATRYQHKPSQPPLWLHEVRDILHAEALSAISLTDLASRVGVHPSYLARMFRRFYHQPVGRYVQRLRVEHSMRLLIESDLGLADIAAAAGFYDQSHFSNVFKLHHGLTPTEFRRTLRSSKGATNSRRFSKTARLPL